MNLVNQAYSIETGCTGISFKCALRLRNLEEAEALLANCYIMKSKFTNEIIGVVAAKLLEKSSIVSISPLAVHPDHQAGILFVTFCENRFLTKY